MFWSPFIHAGALLTLPMAPVASVQGGELSQAPAPDRAGARAATDGTSATEGPSFWTIEDLKLML